MFPFNYIPETINPTIRKILISLICIQFFAFLILIITLLYEFCQRKKNKNIEKQGYKENKKEEGKDIKEKNE